MRDHSDLVERTLAWTVFKGRALTLAVVELEAAINEGVLNDAKSLAIWYLWHRRTAAVTGCRR